MIFFFFLKGKVFHITIYFLPWCILKWNLSFHLESLPWGLLSFVSEILIPKDLGRIYVYSLEAECWISDNERHWVVFLGSDVMLLFPSLTWQHLWREFSELHKTTYKLKFQWCSSVNLTTALFFLFPYLSIVLIDLGPTIA